MIRGYIMKDVDIYNKSIQKQELDMLIEVDKICKKSNLKYFLGYGTVLGAIRHKGFIPWDTDIDILVEIDHYKQFCETIYKNIDSKYELKSIDTDPIYDSLKARVCLKGQLHNLIHIDIFPMVGSPKSTIMKKIFSKISYLNYRCYFVKKVNPNINYSNNKKKRILAFIAKFLLLPIPANIFVKIFYKLSTLYSITESNYLYNICGSYGLKEFIPKEWFEETIYADFEGYKFPIPKEWDKYLTHIYGDCMTPKKQNYV